MDEDTEDGGDEFANGAEDASSKKPAVVLIMVRSHDKDKKPAAVLKDLSPSNSPYPDQKPAAVCHELSPSNSSLPSKKALLRTAMKRTMLTQKTWR